VATSGAQLRALVMQANAEAETAKSILFQAKAKLDEVQNEYRRISEKLGPSVTSATIAGNSIEEAISTVNVAISHAEAYAATVA
jgi:hypothetical protein